MSQKNLNRIFFALIVALALAAGYYKSAQETELKKYRRLEDKYVRVKMMIGEEKIEETLEDSYQYIDKNGQIIKERSF